MFDFIKNSQNTKHKGTKHKGNAYFAHFDEKISSRLALVDGILHISNELQGNQEVLAFFASLKKRGIMKYEFHDPHEFNEQYARSRISFNDTKENELQNMAKDILAQAYKEKTSDIHIKDLGTHCLIRFRIMGMLTDYINFEAEKGRSLIRAIYSSMCQSADSHFSPRERQDARIVDDTFLPKGVYSTRVHTEPTESKDAPEGIGSCMYLRLLHDSTHAEGSLDTRLQTLGFTKEQQETFDYLTTRTGLIIISGPTGHGKSTVLKHCIESMALERPQKAFMSVEDPPEFLLKNVDQIAISTKEENRGKGYIDAIAGAMRSDLDTLLIGEMRYAEAIIAAMNAAMTGHAVWSTLHASDAFSIVLRMVTLLTEKGYSNALEHICEPNVLAGLEYQRLIPILCPECSKTLLSDGNYAKQNKHMMNKVSKTCKNIDTIRILGDGCSHCNNRGIIGQQVVAEVVATDAQLLAYLRKGDFTHAKQYWVKEKGGLTHIQHALQLIEAGKADPLIAEDRLGLPLDFEENSYV